MGSSKMKIISRHKAKCLGEIHYFTDKKCRNGHLAKRLVSNKNCIECTKEQKRKARENPNLTLLTSRLWTGVRRRVKSKNLPFNLTKDWIRQRLEWGRCEVTGLPFQFPNNKGDCGPRFYSATIDRIIPNLGYTKENSRLVIFAYNAAKHTGTDKDVMTMALLLVEKYDTSSN